MRLATFLLGLALVFLGIVLLVTKHHSFAHVVGIWALVIGGLDVVATRPWK